MENPFGFQIFQFISILLQFSSDKLISIIEIYLHQL